MEQIMHLKSVCIPLREDKVYDYVSSTELRTELEYKDS
jgi:hypothetical protein